MHKSLYRSVRQHGFTLMEIMIVVSIIGILASIAMPAYADYIRKARRMDAQVTMAEMAQSLERHYTENNRYTGWTLPASLTSRVSESYSVSTTTLQSQSFEISAVPKGDQAKDKCGTMTLASSGAKTPVMGCWS